MNSDFEILEFNLKAKLVKISSAKEVNKYFSEYLPILDMEIDLKFNLGKPNFKNSRYVLKSIDNSYDLFKKGDVSGLVTLPVCKKSLKKNGFNFCGQTEYLSSLATKKNKKKINEIMILSTTQPEDKGVNLIVGLITTHVPLKDCLKNVNKKLIEEKISLFDSSLKKFWGVKNPKIAIHANRLKQVLIVVVLAQFVWPTLVVKFQTGSRIVTGIVFCWRFHLEESVMNSFKT